MREATALVERRVKALIGSVEGRIAHSFWLGVLAALVLVTLFAFTMGALIMGHYMKPIGETPHLLTLMLVASALREQWLVSQNRARDRVVGVQSSLLLWGCLAYVSTHFLSTYTELSYGYFAFYLMWAARAARPQSLKVLVGFIFLVEVGRVLSGQQGIGALALHLGLALVAMSLGRTGRRPAPSYAPRTLPSPASDTTVRRRIEILGGLTEQYRAQPPDPQVLASMLLVDNPDPHLSNRTVYDFLTQSFELLIRVVMGSQQISRVVVFWRGLEGQMLELWVGEGDHLVRRKGTFSAEQGLVGQLFRERTRREWHNVERTALPYHERRRGDRIGTVLGIPLLSTEDPTQVIGALFAERQQMRRFEAGPTALLDQIAQKIALDVCTAKKVKEVQNNFNTAVALHRMLAIFNATGRLEELGAVLHESIRDELKVEPDLFVLCAFKGELVQPIYASGPSFAEAQTQQLTKLRIDLSEGSLVTQAVRSAETISRSGAERGTLELFSVGMAFRELRSVHLIPLYELHRDEEGTEFRLVKGVWVMGYRSESRTFDKLTQTLLEMVAYQVTVKLDHLRENAEARWLANTDRLTQLKNRGTFDQTIRGLIQHSLEPERRLCLLLIDIDHFKKVNDTFGHHAGDTALKLVARRLSSALRRRSDQSFRYGGEEFAVLLPRVSIKGGLEVAERIRSAVEKMPIEHVGRDEKTQRQRTLKFSVTLSIGVAAWPDDMADVLPEHKETIERYTQKLAREEEMEAVLDELVLTLGKRADDALYTAKGRGRNQVQHWTSEMSVERAHHEERGQAAQGAPSAQRAQTSPPPVAVLAAPMRAKGL